MVLVFLLLTLTPFNISILVLLTLNKYLSIGCERHVIMFWKYKKWYMIFVIKFARSFSFSDLSLQRIEINCEQMIILWTHYEHNMMIIRDDEKRLGIPRANLELEHERLYDHLFVQFFDLLYRRYFPDI